MTKCVECKIKFPDELIDPAFIDGEYFNLCAVDALKIFRIIHNQPDLEFQGERTKVLYEETLEYLTSKNAGGKT